MGVQLAGADEATRRVMRGVVPQSGHSLGVLSVAFSPDGKQALSGSWDGTLKLWDISTGQLLRTFEGHSGGAASVAVSPNGKFATLEKVATASRSPAQPEFKLVTNSVAGIEGARIAFLPRLSAAPVRETVIDQHSLKPSRDHAV